MENNNFNEVVGINNNETDDILKDYEESNKCVESIDPNNIMGIARNLVLQLLNNLPDINNIKNVQSNRCFQYPTKNIIASRAMISDIFRNTATYLFNIFNQYIYSADKLTISSNIGFGTDYYIDLCNINSYLSDSVNISNINNIAGTIIFASIVEWCNISRIVEEFEGKKTNLAQEKQKIIESSNEYIVILTHILNCLGYFAYECRSLMFYNVDIDCNSAFKFNKS